MPQVGLAQDFDKLLERLILSAFCEVDTTQFKKRVVAFLIERVRGRKTRSRHREVACIERLATCIEVGRDGIRRRSGSSEEFGRLNARCGRNIGRAQQLTQRCCCAVGITACDLIASLDDRRIARLCRAACFSPILTQRRHRVTLTGSPGDYTGRQSLRHRLRRNRPSHNRIGRCGPCVERRPVNRTGVRRVTLSLEALGHREAGARPDSVLLP